MNYSKFIHFRAVTKTLLPHCKLATARCMNAVFNPD